VVLLLPFWLIVSRRRSEPTVHEGGEG
jgi:hypothetical protein